jgi:hypothetical protein
MQKASPPPGDRAKPKAQPHIIHNSEKPPNRATEKATPKKKHASIRKTTRYKQVS